MNARVLLVEDDPGLRRTVRDRLRRDGFAVELAADGETALTMLADHPVDVIVLDIMLPGQSGLEVCRRIRDDDPDIGIIMLTALGETADKISGLGLGADDYLTKPFELAELVARIQALLRRTRGTRARAHGVSLGDIAVDLRRAEVTRGDTSVDLSATEFNLLRYLLEHRGAALSRDELLAEVWGYDSQVTTRTVDMHIANLRRKLEPNPRRPRYLITVHGVGYKLL